MSEAFESYEHQYCEVSASLARRCTAAAAFQGGNATAEIKSDIDWAEALIRKMDLELRNLQPRVRTGLLEKHKEYKSDFNNLKDKLKKIYNNGNAQQDLREELLELGMADILGSRLLMATERQNQTTDRLRDSHSTILHAEGIGVSILHDLEQQRESLLGAHDTLHTVDDNIGKSRRIIIAMVRRMDRDKWIMCGIITLLVLVILVILYFKFVH